MTTTLPQKFAETVAPHGATVTLAVVAVGSSVKVYIDGEQKLNTTYAPLDSGSVSLVTTASQPSGEVVFGPIRIWKL